MKKGTLIAVGVFALLLAAVLATREHGNVSVGMPSLELPTIDPASVTEIDVTGPMAATLKKSGDAWTVADPAKPDAAHPADPAQVKAALDQLKELRPGTFISEKPEKQAELQVDDAKGLKVKILGASGPLLSIVLGKSAPNGTYMRVEGKNETFTTIGGFARMIRKDAKGWRKRTFFPAAASDLTKISIKHADGTTLTLEGADGKWSLEPGTATPSDFRFDAAAATRVATTLANLSSTDFGDDVTDQAAGLDKPSATIVATRKEGTPITVTLGSPPPAALAPDGGAGAKPFNGATPVRVEGDSQIYLVASFQADGLLKKATDLRDLTLVNFEPLKATKVSFQFGDKKTVIAKKGGEWELTEPSPPPAGTDFDEKQVMPVVGSLKTIRGQKVMEGVSEKEAGLNKPSLTIDIESEGGQPQHLEFGGPVKGEAGPPSLYVRGSIDKLIYAVPAGARSRYERGPDQFKKRAPMPQGGQMNGLQNLPPDVRAKLEAQMRQQHH